MSRIKFVDKDAVVKPSPGSNGFARQHVAHRGSDEIARLNARIRELEDDAKRFAETYGVRIQEAARVIEERDAEIVQLKADLNKRVFSEFPDFSQVQTVDNRVDSVDNAVDNAKPDVNTVDNAVDTPVDNRKPWEIEGITRQGWYARQKRAAAKAG